MQQSAQHYFALDNNLYACRWYYHGDTHIFYVHYFHPLMWEFFPQFCTHIGRGKFTHKGKMEYDSNIILSGSAMEHYILI